MKKTLLFLTLFFSLQIFAQAPDLSQCDDNNDGFAIFDLGMQTPFLLNGQSPATFNVAYFVTQTDATVNANPIAFENTYMNMSPGVQTIFARVTNETDQTFTISTFNIRVIPTPNADELPNVTTCNAYTLPPLSANNNYYTGPNGTGLLLSPGSELTATQTIYVFAANQAGGLSCSDETSFMIIINATPPSFPVANVIACDQYVLPALPSGYAYYSQPNGTGNVITPSMLITTSQTIYVYAANGNCFSESSFNVTIIASPNPSLQGGFVCTENAPFLLDSGLSDSFYAFAWSLNGILIPTATSSTYTATMTGTYSVNVSTTTTPSCFSEVSAVVALTSQNLNFTLDIVDQNATAIPATAGNYNYALDGGDAQSSNIFENLSIGVHILQITDSCGNSYNITFQITTPNPPTGATSQTFGQGQTLADIVTTGQNVQWYANDAIGAKNTVENPLPMDTLLVNGTTYYATQTINGAESTTRLAVTVSVGLGIAGNAFQHLAFYPNPVKNALEISNNQTIDSIVIVNLLGQRIFDQKVKDTHSKIELSTINPGIYLVKIQSGNQQKTVRIIKE